jgi:transposase
MSKQLQIRNSTAEFLIFQAEDKAQGVQVFYQDETIGASQKAIAALFDVDRSVITKHLKNIFETGELLQESVCAKFAHTAEDGKTYSTFSMSEIPTRYLTWATTEKISVVQQEDVRSIKRNVDYLLINKNN